MAHRLKSTGLDDLLIFYDSIKAEESVFLAVEHFPLPGFPRKSGILHTGSSLIELEVGPLGRNGNIRGKGEKH